MIAAIAVTMMAARYSFDRAAPYIKEFPTINSVGRHLATLGIKLTEYERRTVAPVPRKTPVLEADSVENRVIKEMPNTPNNH